MKPSNIELIGKIVGYSSAALAYIHLNSNLKAEVVYVNIDPDIILDESPEGAWLDIDGNGTDDFGFLNSSFTFYSFSFGTYRTRQDILAGPYIPSNAIAGSIKEIYGVGLRYYPNAINNSNLIDEGLEWQINGQQILAIRTYFMEVYQFDGGNWYPQMIDHYLGIRFVDDFGMDHYGWIRCSVRNEGRLLEIKDFAYEVEPDKPIRAGDTVSFQDIDESNNLQALVYSYGSSIYIDIDKRSTEKYEIRVLDISGKLIKNEFSYLEKMQITLNNSRGIYLVEIISGNQKLVKELIVE